MEQLNSQFENSLIAILKNMIETFLSQHSQISMNGFAQKSNVSLTTLRRITSMSIKGDIAPHTVLNIVSYIKKEKNIKKLLISSHPVISEYLSEYFSPYIFDQEDQTYSVDLNELLSDKMNYIIYKLAANRSGVTLIEIAEIFGQLGMQKVNEWLAKKIVSIDHNNRIHAKDKNFSLDLDIAVGHLPELLKFYKANEIPQGKNLFYSLSESLNADAIQKIKQIQKEAVLKIHQVMNDDQSYGTIPYFTLNICDTLEMSNQEIQ